MSIFFLIFWFVVFFLTLTIERYNPTHVNTLSYFPQWTWIIYFIYLFFPSKKYFNGNISFFVKLIFKDMFLSLCKNMKFIYLWLSSQYLSFVIIFEDLIYGICYSIKKLVLINNPNFDWDVDFFIKIVIHVIIFLLLMIKIVQCLNAFCSSNHKSKKIKYIMETCKFGFITIFVIVTLLDSINNFSNISIIILISLLTIILILWEMKYDFGFIVVYYVKGITHT